MGTNIMLRTITFVKLVWRIEMKAEEAKELSAKANQLRETLKEKLESCTMKLREQL